MPDLGLEMVEWRDAHFDFDQQDTNEDYIMSTVGWVLGLDGGYLHIASETLPNGYRAITHIPESSIVGRSALSVDTDFPVEVVP